MLKDEGTHSSTKDLLTPKQNMHHSSVEDSSVLNFSPPQPFIYLFLSTTSRFGKPGAYYSSLKYKTIWLVAIFFQGSQAD